MLMLERLSRQRKNREFLESFAKRIQSFAPAKIRSISGVRNPCKSSVCGKNAEVRVTFEVERDGNLSELKQVTEPIFHQREAYYCFLILASYILDHHPTVLPARFDIVFSHRHWKKEYLEELLEKIDLPVKAPEKYPGKWHTDEELPAFFRRVWGRYLPGGLSMPLLKRLDKSLYLAMLNYRRTYEWPEDLALPNREVALRDAVKVFREQGVFALTPSQHVAVAQFLKRQTEKPTAPTAKRGPPSKSRGRVRSSRATLG